MGSSILFSKLEGAGGRFPDFIAEVQELFRRYKLPVGTTDAVLKLGDGIAEPGPFRDDLLSMANVLWLQDKEITTLELLGLILVAARGEDGTDALAQEAAFEQPVRNVFNLLVEARRLRDKAEEASQDGEGAGSGLVEPQDFPEESEGTQPADAPVAAPTRPAMRQHGESVLARALALSAEGEAFGRGGAGVSGAVSSGPEGFAGETLLARPLFAEAWKETPVSHSIPSWAVGACGVVLGLVLGLLWSRRTPSPASVQATPGAVAHQGFAGAGRGSRLAAPARLAGDAVEGPSGFSAAMPRAFSAPRPAHAVGSKAGSDDLTADEGALSRGRAGDSGASSRAAKARASTASAGFARARAIDLNAPADPGDSQPLHSGPRVKVPSVVTGTSGIMAANVISSPAPSYPGPASAARVQGEVVIEAVVDRDGGVTEARVVSGPPLLREAALKAVQEWRYRPYEVDGSPTEIATTARVEFHLNP